MYLAVFTFKEKEHNHIIEDFSFYLEIFFVITMILEFITDFKKPGEHVHEKDLKVIMKKYLSSHFIIDLIPLLPLP